MPTDRPSLWRVAARAAATPWAWLPASLGTATAAVGAAAGGQGGAFLLFAGVSGLVLGAASAATRLLTRTGDLTRDVIRDDRRAEAEGRGGAGRPDQLAAARADAAGDRDSLARLDRLSRALDRMVRLALDDAGGDDATGLPTHIADRVRDLWDRCLAGVGRATLLGRTAGDLATDAARRRVLGDRRDLLGEVDAALDRLDASLDHLRLAAVGQGDATSREIADLTRELDRGLDVARRVDERLARLDRDADADRRVDFELS